ncbi:hypothetical protein BN1708_005635 [Verticillium longisporum]|uniref:Uncharacterized protein n=1 Tax=Verticillium longisporum TaxID=100787 RepID=A0A0G4MCJ1_VERLO|nr:hypothetical protein BN1708_005635 [Verticillium longisporum]
MHADASGHGHAFARPSSAAQLHRPVRDDEGREHTGQRTWVQSLHEVAPNMCTLSTCLDDGTSSGAAERR